MESISPSIDPTPGQTFILPKPQLKNRPEGNGAIFSKKFWGWFDVSNILLGRKGAKFSPVTSGVIWCTACCTWGRGGNAVQLFPTNLWGDSTYQLLRVQSRGDAVQFIPTIFLGGGWYLTYQTFRWEQGEMLPIFSHKFFGVTRCIKFCVQSKGKCCPFLSKNLSTCREMLPILSNNCSTGDWNQSIGEMLPKICQEILETIWTHVESFGSIFPVLSTTFDMWNQPPQNIVGKNWTAFSPVLNTKFDTSNDPQKVCGEKLGSVSPFSEHDIWHVESPRKAWEKSGSISPWSGHKFGTGGNAARFFPSFLGVIRCIKVWVQNRGKCCPIFRLELFGVIRCIKRCAFRTGVNAAQFFSREFWGDSMYQILCAQQGKCCPFSPWSLWSHSTYQIVCLEQGEMLPTMSFLESLDVWYTSHVCLEQGEMLPNFLPWFFLGDSMYQILCSEHGDMLPKISPQFLLGWFDVSIFCSEQGQMLPKFFPTNVLGWFNVSNFVFRTGGNAARFFPTNVLGWFEVSSVVFRTEENAAQFFTMNFLEWFDVSNFVFRTGGSAAQLWAFWTHSKQKTRIGNHFSLFWGLKSPQKVRGENLGSISPFSEKFW